MAAALGDAEAELNLARMYSTGHGVPRDDVEAAKWLRRAADQGRVVAQTVLAAMYIAGRGVVKSDTEAVTWERKAADQGYAAAQSMLGSAYEEGKGAPQSDAEAARWLRQVHGGLRCRDYAAHLMTPAQIAQAEALAAAKTGQQQPAGARDRSPRQAVAARHRRRASAAIAMKHPVAALRGVFSSRVPTANRANILDVFALSGHRF